MSESYIPKGFRGEDTTDKVTTCEHPKPVAWSFNLCPECMGLVGQAPMHTDCMAYADGRPRTRDLPGSASFIRHQNMMSKMSEPQEKHTIG